MLGKELGYKIHKLTKRLWDEDAKREGDKEPYLYDKYCNNCGRIHEGRLVETFLDGDNKPLEIVVCSGPVYTHDREYEQAKAQKIVDNIPPDFESTSNENTDKTIPTKDT